MDCIVRNHVSTKNRYMYSQPRMSAAQHYVPTAPTALIPYQTPPTQQHHQYPQVAAPYYGPAPVSLSRTPSPEYYTSPETHNIRMEAHNHFGSMQGIPPRSWRVNYPDSSNSAKEHLFKYEYVDKVSGKDYKLGHTTLSKRCSVQCDCYNCESFHKLEAKRAAAREAQRAEQYNYYRETAHESRRYR